MKKMDVQVSWARADEIAAEEDIKFVLGNRGRKDIIILGHQGIPHIDLLKNGTTLIGAGQIKKWREGRKLKCSAEWGSLSCRKREGYDRPADPNEAERIVQEVADTVRDWLNKIRK